MVDINIYIPKPLIAVINIFNGKHFHYAILVVIFVFKNGNSVVLKTSGLTWTHSYKMELSFLPGVETLVYT